MSRSRKQSVIAARSIGCSHALLTAMNVRMVTPGSRTAAISEVTDWGARRKFRLCGSSNIERQRRSANHKRNSPCVRSVRVDLLGSSAAAEKTEPLGLQCCFGTRAHVELAIDLLDVI